MPYVDDEARSRIKHSCPPMSAGELNYCLTKLVNGYLKRNPLNYTAINEAIGVLECAKLELYRRVAAPYEDRKLLQNGEVYSCINHAEAPDESASAVTQLGP